MLGRFPLGQTNGHFGFPVWLTLVCFPLTLHNLSPIVKSLCIPHRFLSLLSVATCNIGVPFLNAAASVRTAFFLGARGLLPRCCFEPEALPSNYPSRNRFAVSIFASKNPKASRLFFLPARPLAAHSPFLPPYFPPKAR